VRSRSQAPRHHLRLTLAAAAPPPRPHPQAAANATTPRLPALLSHPPLPVEGRDLHEAGGGAVQDPAAGGALHPAAEELSTTEEPL
jgi:hypothetical protein